MQNGKKQRIMKSLLVVLAFGLDLLLKLRTGDSYVE